MKITQLYSIAFGCPKCRINFGYPSGSRDKDCPLFSLDQLSSFEKMSWIDELSENAIDAILKHHSECAKNY